MYFVTSTCTRLIVVVGVVVLFICGNTVIAAMRINNRILFINPKIIQQPTIHRRQSTCSIDVTSSTFHTQYSGLSSYRHSEYSTYSKHCYYPSTIIRPLKNVLTHRIITSNLKMSRTLSSSSSSFTVPESDSHDIQHQQQQQPNDTTTDDPEFILNGLSQHIMTIDGQDEEEDEKVEKDDDDDKQRKQQHVVVVREQQLWLDLRGTAVNPIEALNFLKELLDIDNINNYIDTIIIPKECQRIEGFFSPDNEQLLHGISIVQTTDDDSILCKTLRTSNSSPTSSSSGGEESIDMTKTITEVSSSTDSIATILTPTRNSDKTVTFDPMAALDITSNNGQWLLIDPVLRDNNNNDKDRTFNSIKEQLTSMLQLVSTASMSLSSSGLFLSSTTIPNYTVDTKTNVSTKPTTTIIQVGVFCSTHDVFMLIDPILAQFHLSNDMGGCDGTTTITSSGLVIPTSSSSSTTTTTVVGNDRMTTTTTSKKTLRTSIILPFDSQLWRTAIDMQQTNKRSR